MLFFEMRISSSIEQEFRIESVTDYDLMNGTLSSVLRNVSEFSTQGVDVAFEFLVDSIRTSFEQCTTQICRRVRPNWERRPWVNAQMRGLINRKKVLLRKKRDRPTFRRTR